METLSTLPPHLNSKTGYPYIQISCAGTSLTSPHPFTNLFLFPGAVHSERWCCSVIMIPIRFSKLTTLFLNRWLFFLASSFRIYF